MDSAYSPAFVVPNPQIPKTIGILNIIFASLLLANNLCTGTFYALMPTIIRLMKIPEQHLKEQVEKRWRDQSESFARQEAVASNEQEKAAVRAQRASFQSTPRPVIPSMTTGFRMFEDRRVMAYLWTDVATGLALNTAMLVAGLWLVKLRESGRRLALWAAGLKLARLVILMAVSMVVVLPIQQATMKKQMAEMEQFQQSTARARPLPALSPARVMQLSASMGGLGMVVGSVLAGAYPVVVLILLSLPRARAACLAQPGPQPEPGSA